MLHNFNDGNIAPWRAASSKIQDLLDHEFSRFCLIHLQAGILEEWNTLESFSHRYMVTLEICFIQHGDELSDDDRNLYKLY